MPTWDPQSYNQNTRFVSELGMPVVALLRPRPAERILDLGCGDGVLSKKLADVGADVTGIDGSLEMVKEACALGVRGLVADGAALPVVGEFDAVFSNAALHWMTAPDPVIRGVWQALKPTGRFVGEMGGAGNVGQIRRALHASLSSRGIDPTTVDPWYFPTTTEYSEKLEAAGFVVDSIELIERPTPLPTGIKGWIDSVAHPYLNIISPPQRELFLDEVIQRLRPEIMSPEGVWVADYVRLRFHASKIN